MIRKFLPATALFLAASAFAAPRQSVSLQQNAPATINVTDLTEGCVERACAARVTVENLSGETLVYTATLKPLNGPAVSRTISVPPTASRFADITATIEPGERGYYWGSASVKIEGPGTNAYSTASLSSPSSSSGGHMPSSGSTRRQFALSPSLHTNYAGRIQKGHETRGNPVSVASLDPYVISGDWRTMRAFDAMVFTGDDWRTAVSRPEAREALLRYAAQGGRIRILANAGETPPALPGKGDRQTYGFGLISVFRNPVAEAVDAIDGGTVAGRAKYNEADNPFNTGTLWDNVPSTSDARYRPLDKLLPAAARAGLGIVLIIGLFAILVGPVNLFWFCRGQRRHRMLWLTPVIALATSLFLSGYIVVADGTGGEGHRRRLRLRPAGTNSEFLVQEQSSRTGLLLASGFDVPRDALIWRLPDEPTANRRRGYMREDADCREDDGHASGAWFKSRYAQAQSLELWDAARGGVALAGTPEAPELVSSVDGTLDRVFVRDAAGLVWTAEAVAPGAKAKLRRAKWAEFTGWFNGVKSTSGYTQAQRLDKVFEARGWYYAESKNLRAASPGTLGSIRWNDLPDILVGDLSTGEKPGAK